jgi:hypothetical protein
LTTTDVFLIQKRVNVYEPIIKTAIHLKKQEVKKELERLIEMEEIIRGLRKEEVKNSQPDPEMAFQSAKIYICCLHAHLISSYDKLQLVRSSSLCQQVLAVQVYVKMDKLEYRAVVKFLVLNGLTPNEIHPKLRKVFGNSAPSISTVKKWAAEFKCGQR